MEQGIEAARHEIASSKKPWRQIIWCSHGVLGTGLSGIAEINAESAADT